MVCLYSVANVPLGKEGGEIASGRTAWFVTPHVERTTAETRHRAKIVERCRRFTATTYAESASTLKIAESTTQSANMQECPCFYVSLLFRHETPASKFATHDATRSTTLARSDRRLFA